MGFKLTKILGLCHKTLWKHQVELKSKINHIVGAKEKKAQTRKTLLHGSGESGGVWF